MPWLNRDKCSKSPTGKHERAIMDRAFKKDNDPRYWKVARCKHCDKDIGKPVAM